MLGLRGHYFAIGTLGLGIAAAELAAGWDWIGAGSGMVPPQFPGAFDRTLVFYYIAFVLAVATFHILNGVRLLFVDLGIGLEAQDKAFYAALIATAAITVASIPTFLLGAF
jgi:ABC-type branched-subunit amino acid transport system permease subunit